MNNKAIIYCRVSSKEQAEQGYSLEAQEQECKKFALNAGYEIDKVFIERGESAKTQNRTELQKLIKYTVENKGKLSFLIIWKYDRLARNLTDQTELVKHFSQLNISVFSVTENNDDNSIGRLMRNIIGSFAQFENDVKSERTLNGMKQAIKEGRWCWHPPLGYKSSKDSQNKPLLVHSDKSSLVKEIFKTYETGLYSQEGIIKKYKSKGISFSKNQMNRILRNPLYTGLIKVEWFPEPIEGIHKPIIDRDTFYKVQSIMEGRRPAIVPKVRNHPDFPLRKFIICPKCKKKLTGSWSKGRTNKYPYYRCTTKECNLSVRKEIIDEQFFKVLKSIQPKTEVLKLFEAIVIDVWKSKQTGAETAKITLEKELKELLEKKKKIEDLLIAGSFDAETYKTRSEEIQSEMMLKRLALNEQIIECNDIESCLNYCKYFLSNIADLWQNADLSLKQRFQSLIFPEGLYFDGKKFGTTKIAYIFKQFQDNTFQMNRLGSATSFNWNHILTDIMNIYKFKPYTGNLVESYSASVH